MQQIDLIPLLAFAFATSFTPGPNNIAVASMGISYGYRQTIRFLLGISVGFFFVLLLCGILSTILVTILPSLEPWLRWIGAGYILWLAWETAKAGYAGKNNQKGKPLGFSNGLLLQFLNPKAIFYGMTMFTSFLHVLSSPIDIALASGGLAVFTYFAISCWTLLGSLINTYFGNEKLRFTFNLILSLLLVYTALEISGLLS